MRPKLVLLGSEVGGDLLRLLAAIGHHQHRRLLMPEDLIDLVVELHREDGIAAL